MADHKPPENILALSAERRWSVYDVLSNCSSIRRGGGWRGREFLQPLAAMLSFHAAPAAAGPASAFVSSGRLGPFAVMVGSTMAVVVVSWWLGEMARKTMGYHS